MSTNRQLITPLVSATPLASAAVPTPTQTHRAAHAAAHAATDARPGRAYPYAVVSAEVTATTVRVAVLLGGRLGKVTTRRTDELLAVAPGRGDIVPGLLRAIRGILPST